MRQHQTKFEIGTDGPGLYDITRPVCDWCAGQPGETGLLTLFVRHTSASLLIQENADPDVLADLQTFFAKLAPHAPSAYRHSTEGPDDMPAHIRASLTQTHLSIPVAGGRPALGTWQGIYLFEHRDAPHRRSVIAHLIIA